MKCLWIILCLATLFSCRERHQDTSAGFAKGAQVLRIGSKEDPESLDPRKVRDLANATYLHMLYDGLVRLDSRGEPVPGVAKSWELSPDQKTYTFYLRDSQWSNGDPLTAEDFIRTWKSVLQPNFAAPNAYQFYLIKGAKQVKEGKLSSDEMGLSAPDPHTLVVELEEAAPYFPELVASHFFYPVHREHTSKSPISNGPFRLHHYSPRYEIVVQKNPHYWDEREVHLDGIVVAFVDNHTALRLYENQELDWVGSPLGIIPQEALVPLKKSHQILSATGAGVHWLRVSTKDAPLNNTSLRKALATAINRKELVEHVLQGNQKAAQAIVPPAIGKRQATLVADGDVPAAWELFQKALEEMDLSKDELPEITLIYPVDERSHKVAQTLQQQWFKALGITIKLQRLETQLFIQRVKERNFQIAIGSWFADIRDPINFLDIFRSKEVPTNATSWENVQFAELLRASMSETNPTKRLALLNQAEDLLLGEMPVIPLYFASYNYVKDITLLGVYFSDLGYLDFKYAFFTD